jgi:hypothetical protein
MIRSQSSIVDLPNLQPHTSYVISVACIPLVDDREAGFWSDPSSLEFETSPDGINVHLHLHKSVDDTVATLH